MQEDMLTSTTSSSSSSSSSSLLLFQGRNGDESSRSSSATLLAGTSDANINGGSGIGSSGSLADVDVSLTNVDEPVKLVESMSFLSCSVSLTSMSMPMSISTSTTTTAASDTILAALDVLLSLNLLSPYLSEPDHIALLSTHRSHRRHWSHYWTHQRAPWVKIGLRHWHAGTTLSAISEAFASHSIEILVGVLWAVPKHVYESEVWKGLLSGWLVEACRMTGRLCGTQREVGEGLVWALLGRPYDRDRGCFGSEAVAVAKAGERRRLRTVSLILKRRRVDAGFEEGEDNKSSGAWESGWGFGKRDRIGSIDHDDDNDQGEGGSRSVTSRVGGTGDRIATIDTDQVNDGTSKRERRQKQLFNYLVPALESAIHASDVEVFKMIASRVPAPGIHGPRALELLLKSIMECRESTLFESLLSLNPDLDVIHSYRVQSAMAAALANHNPQGVLAAISAGASCENPALLIKAAEFGFEDVVKAILDYGVDVDMNGGHALVKAAGAGQLWILKMLVDAKKGVVVGTNSDSANRVRKEEGKSKGKGKETQSKSETNSKTRPRGSGRDFESVLQDCMDSACENGRSTVVAYCLALGAHIKSEHAFDTRDSQTMVTLFNAGVKLGYVGPRALVTAANYNNGDMIIALLDAGVDPDVKDGHVLKKVATWSDTHLTRRTLNSLIQHGASLERSPQTLLKSVCGRGVLGSLNVLLEAGIRVDFYDAAGHAATFADIITGMVAGSNCKCSSCWRFHAKLLERLLSVGIDMYGTTTTTTSTTTPLEQEKPMIEALRSIIDQGCSLAMTTLLSAGIRLSTSSLNTLLPVAARHKHGFLLRLISIGADPKSPQATEAITTAMESDLAVNARILARRGAKLPDGIFMEAINKGNIDMIEAILDFVEDIGEGDSEVLMVAVMNNRIGLVKRLILLGIDVGAREGRALRISQEMGFDSVQVILRDAGAV
ncbi:hypothetical protein HDU76_002782 [Blyttiomyces sp. JEL0837]|nr:hypothetical protein HDU76_002782 [Blyttiomyces sp. JEL0837]